MPPLSGDISATSISAVAVSLKANSTLSAALNADAQAKSMSLTLGASSKRSVGGTSYLTALTDSDRTLASVDDRLPAYHDASATANAWLASQTIALAEGGELAPRK